MNPKEDTPDKKELPPNAPPVEEPGKLPRPEKDPPPSEPPVDDPSNDPPAGDPPPAAPPIREP